MAAVVYGVNVCVDPRASPRSCGSEHNEWLTILVSCASVVSMIALAAVVGFTMRRWVSHGVTIRTLPDATSFALTIAGILYFLRFAILSNVNTIEHSYDSSISKWWRFVERLIIITIISCYASVAVFLATIINNNPKHRNRPIGAIVFGILYGIGVIIIIIEAGVVTSPPVLSHSPSLVHQLSAFNNTGHYQLFVSIVLSFGLLSCASLLWRARQSVIAYARSSQQVKPLPPPSNGPMSPNKIAPTAAKNFGAGAAAVQSVGKRKFDALLDRLQQAVYVCIITPPLAIAIIVRDVAWFSLVPFDTTSGGNANWFTAHVIVHITEIFCICVLISMFCQLFEASTFTKNGFEFFRPKQTVKVKLGVSDDQGNVGMVTFGGTGVKGTGITTASTTQASKDNNNGDDAPSKNVSAPTSSSSGSSGASANSNGAKATNRPSAWTTSGTPAAATTDAPSSPLPPPTSSTIVSPLLVNTTAQPSSDAPANALKSPLSHHESKTGAPSSPRAVLVDIKSANSHNGADAGAAAKSPVPSATDEATTAKAIADESVYRARAQEQSVALVVSRDAAQFWRDPRVRTEGWKYLFTFPMPSNDADIRLHALCVITLVALHLLLLRLYNTPVLGWYVFAGFLLRTMAGPRFDIQAHIVLFVLRPILVERWRLWKSEWAPGVPRRFAQSCGIMFSGAALALQYALPDNPEYSNWMWAVLFIATSLQCWWNLCMGCGMFWVANSMGLLPPDWCAACLINFEEDI